MAANKAALPGKSWGVNAYFVIVSGAQNGVIVTDREIFYKVKIIVYMHLSKYCLIQRYFVYNAILLCS